MLLPRGSGRLGAARCGRPSGRRPGSTWPWSSRTRSAGAWRTGQTNIAIGCAGIAALRGYHGEVDPDGRTLVTPRRIAVVDELAGAAELVMGKLDRVPVAVVRGYAYPRPAEDEPDPGRRAPHPAGEFDLFR